MNLLLTYLFHYRPGSPGETAPPSSTKRSLGVSERRSPFRSEHHTK